MWVVQGKGYLVCRHFVSNLQWSSAVRCCPKSPAYKSFAYLMIVDRPGLTDACVRGDEAGSRAAAAVPLPGRLSCSGNPRWSFPAPAWRGAQELQTWQNSHPRRHCRETPFIHIRRKLFAPNFCVEFFNAVSGIFSSFYRVTTCLENLKISGNLTAVGDFSKSQRKVA